MVWGHSKLCWKTHRVSKKAEDIPKLFLISLNSSLGYGAVDSQEIVSTGMSTCHYDSLIYKMDKVDWN